jgi:stage II sporulation protein D
MAGTEHPVVRGRRGILVISGFLAAAMATGALLFLLGWWLFGGSLPEVVPSGATIRVLLATDDRHVRLSSTDGARVMGLAGEPSITLSAGAAVEAEITREGVDLPGFLSSAEGLRLVSSTGGAIVVDGRRYRGDLLVLPEDGRLRVVNEVDLESYVRGVVGAEMPPTSPSQALAAQAVLARSFALVLRDRNLTRNPPRPWDLTDGTSSQVYGGMEVECHRTDRSVAVTRGQVLHRSGHVVEGSFHASCGGRTSAARAVFALDPAPEAGVSCPGCRSEDVRWSVVVPRARLEQAVRACGVKGPVLELSSGMVDDGGRWLDLSVRTDKGVATISANRFRLEMGPGTVRSMAIDGVQVDGDRVLLSGKGHGHGVGLCQRGARVLAETGFSASEILSHYFVGVALGRSGA